MNTVLIKFITDISQKVLVAVTSNIIYKLIKDILLWVLLFIVIIIVGLVLIQYSGLYDVYGFLVEKFPILEVLVNNLNKIKMN